MLVALDACLCAKEPTLPSAETASLYACECAAGSEEPWKAVVEECGGDEAAEDAVDGCEEEADLQDVAYPWGGVGEGPGERGEEGEEDEEVGEGWVSGCG